MIGRDDHVLMVRERVLDAVSGRHDGPEYWTLPGGGIEPGEYEASALRREVYEEVGLTVLEARKVAQVPYPSGTTAVFRVEHDGAVPRLGADDLPCGCPRMVGLDWVRVPDVRPEHGGSPVPMLIYAW